MSTLRINPQINLDHWCWKRFTGGPLSVMHFPNELIKHGFQIRWINIDGEGLKEKEFREHALNCKYLSKFVLGISL